ncbi:TetR/AcrR family transcriptional regulator [Paenibacillus sp. sptzw28]|uniref:TetR/AcrR family transcriptional regulator n=1 Tax=Paenibacillus sp. sptzw28 TaxID=715179 RepID=UPI001C6F0C6A|nr:TetR/AcrR family transcriptional regulator [Paenibacillus sp. sptzw28]QYR20763.1 TetR/AcrR family transcriptional regulator [Paenibacillus sp. sptzw28]
MKRTETTIKYIEKIKPILRKSRLSQLTVDEIARHMDISKATLYKYFSSKDEIIEVFVEHCLEYVSNVDALVLDEGISYGERFQLTYDQSIKSVLFVPDILLEDLREIYPKLFEKLNLAQQQRYKNLQRFFDSGLEKGIFNRINFTLFMVQDEVVLRHIFEPMFAIQYDLTLKQALLDFYKLKKIQLFKPEMLDKVDDAAAEQQISDALRKISSGL